MYMNIVLYKQINNGNDNNKQQEEVSEKNVQ